MNKQKKNIILGVTGSIAAYKAADIVRSFQKKSYSVSVIMTKGAEQFITPLTLATLSGERVYRKMFDQKQSNWQIGHLSLAQKADAILVAPATANIIGKIANGIADDLLTCTVMATQAPVFIAPAMNTKMYHNAILQANCRRLEEHGFRLIPPGDGELACGEYGEGRLADIDEIVSFVDEALA